MVVVLCVSVVVGLFWFDFSTLTVWLTIEGNKIKCKRVIVFVTYYRYSLVNNLWPTTESEKKIQNCLKWCWELAMDEEDVKRNWKALQRKQSVTLCIRW